MTDMAILDFEKVNRLLLDDDTPIEHESST